MMTLTVLCALVAAQVPRGLAAEELCQKWQAVVERAAKQIDFDRAGFILASALADESTLRCAFSGPELLDGRSVYILFGGNWGSRADVTWKDRLRWRRILADSVAREPALVRSVIRAERYDAYLRERNPSGAAGINSFPFFAYSAFADDLAEVFIESLRTETCRPARAVMAPHSAIVAVSADEMEVNLLSTWEILCGVCDRMELVENSTTKNWRQRFPGLDSWFQKNRPFIVWDDQRSCIRIDREALAGGRPTPRASRSIPELRPPWLAGPPALEKRKDGEGGHCSLGECISKVKGVTAHWPSRLRLGTS